MDSTDGNTEGAADGAQTEAGREGSGPMAVRASISTVLMAMAMQLGSKQVAL